jgi:hypothetical protein
LTLQSNLEESIPKMDEEDNGPLSKWRTQHNHDPVNQMDDDISPLLEDAINSGSTWRIVAVSLFIIFLVLLPLITLATIFYLEAHK